VAGGERFSALGQFLPEDGSEGDRGDRNKLKSVITGDHVSRRVRPATNNRMI
jgi:hypothetical protein